MTGGVSTSPDDASTGSDPRLAGGRLTIDLRALAENYRRLARRAAPARVAGVVKANAYGLGAEAVAPVLWREGCRTFFVAMPQEGIALRRILPDADIFVLSGLNGRAAVEAHVEHRLTPVVNSREEMIDWVEHTGPMLLPCALHVDTGMNRLGLGTAEALDLGAMGAFEDAVNPVLVMSHLACGDEPDHPLNRRQLESFRQVAAAFSGVESSLANSPGIFLGHDYAFDVVRPGIALYGGNPTPGRENPTLPVVTAEARIVQVRKAAAGEAVSYGAAGTLHRDTLLAVASVGYADGFHRAGSGAGVPLRGAAHEGAHGFLHGCRVPVVGRVTMDLTVFDVTDIADDAKVGDWIELFGRNLPIDEAAATAGTISYELLTSLGRRYHRTHVGADG